MAWPELQIAAPLCALGLELKAPHGVVVANGAVTPLIDLPFTADGLDAFNRDGGHGQQPPA